MFVLGPANVTYPHLRWPELEQKGVFRRVRSSSRAATRIENMGKKEERRCSISVHEDAACPSVFHIVSVPPTSGFELLDYAMHFFNNTGMNTGHYKSDICYFHRSKILARQFSRNV
jgi:hypothetical protein